MYLEKKAAIAMDSVDKALYNYKQLVAMVDGLCRNIVHGFEDEITCKKGCADCCRSLSLFPVEAVAIANYLNTRASIKEAAHIRQKAKNSEDPQGCPLLEENICLLYEARPIICRTHGYPLLIEQDEQLLVDFCPMNFKDVASVPGTAIIDLNRLNSMLTAINSVFVVAECMKDSTAPSTRVSMKEALLMDL